MSTLVLGSPDASPQARCAQRLAERLRVMFGGDCVVLGVAGSGISLARRLAEEMTAPYDMLMVRRLYNPNRPELTLGALGECGVRSLNSVATEQSELTGTALAAIEHAARQRLAALVCHHRLVHPEVPLAGRTVVVVDREAGPERTAVACQMARLRGARRVVLVAPFDAAHCAHDLTTAVDQIVRFDE